MLECRLFLESGSCMHLGSSISPHFQCSPPSLVCSRPCFVSEFLHYLRRAESGMVETGIFWELTTSESALIKGFNETLAVCIEGEGPYSCSWEVQPQGFVFCGVRPWVDVGKHSGFIPCRVLVTVITMYLWHVPISSSNITILTLILIFFPVRLYLNGLIFFFNQSSSIFI